MIKGVTVALYLTDQHIGLDPNGTGRRRTGLSQT